MCASYIAEPACLSDAPGSSAMMQRSFGQLLAKDYDADVLENALPMMTEAQPIMGGAILDHVSAAKVAVRAA